jgi:hypothetical protein
MPEQFASVRDLTWTAPCLIVVASLCGGVATAPAAHADSVVDFRDAVALLRSSAACAQLAYDPTVAQAAETANRSTVTYLAHTARAVPIEDPLPLLRDLGLPASKAKLLSGASREDDADAIKATILQGYAAIPDCTYTQFGVSIGLDDVSGYHLTSLILAGP